MVENKFQDVIPSLGAPVNGSTSTIGATTQPTPLAQQFIQPQPQPEPQVVTKPPRRFNGKLITLIVAIILLLLGLLAAIFWAPRSPEQQNQSVTGKFNTIEIPLEDFSNDTTFKLLGTNSLTINGQLELNGPVVFSPSAQPSTALPGQMYYDQSSNQLAYYNGSQFIPVGQSTIGPGLTNTNGVLANSGVLSLQGQTGNVTLVAGDGITIDGTTISNSGINSLVAGSPSLVITDNGDGNLTIDSVGAGSGTVASSGGTPGRLAKFTGVQQIEDSLLSESGSVITVNGDLTVTGVVSLANALTVGNGGTGATSLTNNGVLIGQGSGTVAAVTAGGPGLCFQSTAGAPVFASCVNAGSAVTSLNGLTGALTLANATGLVNTITIDDASTSNKGIAEFNGTNFSVSSGTVNTIQNIDTAASPTFGSLTLTGDAAINGGDITSTGTLNITPAGTLTAGSTTQAFTLQGNASSTITATNGASTTSLTFESPTANVVYRFPTAAAGSYDVCTSVGNCGGGSGIGGSGTIGTLSKFTGATTIGDSLLSESGSTITVNGNLNLTSGNQFQINNIPISSADLSNDANLAKLNASQIFTGGSNVFRNSSNSAAAFSVQNALSNQLLTVNTTSGEVALGQGSTIGGRLVFNTASNGNTTTLISAAAGSNRTITLPDDSGTVCLSSGNCGGVGATLQTAYNNSTSPEITLDATRGALTIRDNASPLAANLFEVQNNAGGTTYFGVSATGTNTTGASTVSGNINSTGGTLQTGGTTRVDNTGNLTNIGNLTLSGAISGGTTYSGSGNINTTGGALQTAGTSRVDNTGNLINIGNITATGATTIASTGAGNDIIIDGADQFIVQDAAVFNGLSTFNTDVDLVLTDTENLNITSTATGSSSVNVIGAVLTNNTASGTQQVALLQNAAGSGTTEGLLILDNADTNTAVTNGLQITSAGGGITTAIDVSDPDITTALLFGLNDITGTNFSVTGSSGNFTSAGNATIQGGTVTAGTNSQAGTLALHDGSSNTGTLQVASLGQDTVFTLPDPGGGSATICLSTGNCAGSGSSVTTGGGTTNRLAKFTASQAINDSTITDDGTNVTTSVDVIIQGGDLTVGTTGQLASLVLHDGNGQTTTLQAGNSSGDLTFILPVNAGSANQCLKQSGTGNQLVWDACDGGGGGDSATLQGAYNNGNSITTTDARDIDIVLADTATDSNLDIVVADGSTSFVSFARANGSGTADPAQLLLIDNQDTNRAIAAGIKLQSAAGGLTAAIDATDAEIVDAISVAANNIVGTTGNIDFTNFDVVGATGDITTAGDLAVNGGDITSSGTLTIANSSGNLTINSAGTIELADSTNVTGNADVSGTLNVGTANAFQVAANGNTTTAGDIAVNGGDITSTGGLNITPAGTLTAGSTSQILTLQGNASTTLTGTDSGNTTTLAFSTPTANVTLNLPALAAGTYSVCTSSGNCGGGGGTLQTAYNNSTSPEITLDATRGALTIRDNATPIGANLLEVQDNGGSSTYFGVTVTGTNTTGTSVVSGNINTTGGSLQTNGSDRLTNAGNLVNIGTLTLSGAISGGTTYTGSGNINSTGGTLQTNSINRVDNSGNLVNIGNLTATGAITIASTGAGNDIIIDGADQFIVQDAAVFNGTGTFNTDVDMVFADTENLSITSTITGTNAADLINLVVTNNTSSGTQRGASLTNADGSGTTEALLLLDNADPNTALTSAIQITSAAGGIATALDLSDSDIVTAINFGANDIDGTNFDIAGASGNITAGTYNGQTISSSANFTGTVTIANNLTLTSGDIAVNGGDITSTGALNITPGGTLVVGSTAQTLTLQGNGSTTLTATDSGNTTTVSFTAPTANTTLRLPALSAGTYDLCTSSGNCLGAGVTMQATYNNSTSPEITLDATRGALTIRDNASPIGANLFEIQNNGGSTTYLAVTTGGISVTGAATTSGNINTTTGSLQTNSVTRVDGSGNLVNIGNLTATGAITIASTGAGNDIIIDGSDQFIVQDSSVFNSTSTFNADVDAVLTESENIDVASTVTGSTAVNVLNMTLNNNSSSGTQQLAFLQNAAGSGLTEGLLVLHNADVDTAVTSGLQITSAAGGITTAIDVSDADIVTAINFGANDIDGTNFDIAGASGNITTSGTYNTNTFTSSGLQFGAASTATLQSASGQALNLIAHATSTWGTDAGNLTLQASADSSNLFLVAGDNPASSIANGNDIELRAEDDFIATLTATGQFVIDAANTDSAVNGIGTGTVAIAIDALQGAGGRSNGMFLDYQIIDDGNADQEFRAFRIDINNSEGAGGDQIEGLHISNRDAAANGITDGLIVLANEETVAGSVAFGVRILGNAGGGTKTITTAISAADDNIATALDVGSNSIIGTTADINFTSFDIIGSTGAAAFQNVTNQTNAFQILNAGGLSGLNVDTTNGNLISNPSFETNTTGWALRNAGTITRVTTPTPADGNASLEIVTTAAANDGAKFNFALTSSTQYTLSVFVRTVSAFSTFEIGRSENGSSDTSCATAQTAPIGSWKRITCTFTTGSVGGTTYIYGKQTDATGRTFYIDAVQIETAASATMYRNSKVAVGGSLAINTGSTLANSTNAALYVQANGGGDGVVIRGGDGNIVRNALQVTSPDGVTAFSVNDTGLTSAFFGGNSFFDVPALAVTSTAAAARALDIVGAASQSTDILRVKDSSTNILMSVGSVGAMTFQNGTNSTTAFRILSDTGSSSVPQFVVDTTNSRTYIGNPTADATGALIVLDTKNSAGDPTGIAGGMYYNSTTERMRCYEEARWTNCTSGSLEYDIFDQSEEFMTGSNTTGSAGAGGWGIFSSNTGATLLPIVGAQNHPGITRIGSGTTSNNVASMVMTAVSGISSMTVSDANYFGAIVRPDSGTATMSTRVGIMLGSVSAGETGQGIYFSYSPGTSANWRTVTRGAGGITSNSSSTAYAVGTWYRLEIKKNNSGNWEFYINGALQFTHTTNFPAASSTAVPGFAIETNNTTAKTLDVDWMRIRSGILSR